MKYSGYCRTCKQHFDAPKDFNERDHGLKCPGCKARLSLQFKSVKQVKAELRLADREIGSGLAILVPILK